MAGYPQIPTGAPLFAGRLALFYGALFATLGVQMPFLPVWFAARGIEVETIGLLLAVPMLVRMAAIPAMTRIADRADALRGVLMVSTAAGVVGYALMGLAHGAVAIALAFALASAFYTPAITLTDAYALRGLADRRRYGPVRLWGSAAFIGASFAAGLALPAVGAGDLIWLIVAAMAAGALAAHALAPLPPRALAVRTAVPDGPGSAPPAQLDAPPEPGSATALLRQPAFLLVAAGASLVQASHAVLYGFGSLDWQQAGLSGPTIGALWALGVVAEIVLFWLSGRGALRALPLLLSGAAGAVLRWLAMAAVPPLAALAVLQCLHALSFGATHLGAVMVMARIAPAQFGATAQGYLAVAQGLAMAGASVLAGALYARYGALAYLAMALMAATGGGCLLLALRLRASLG
jgi:PPP family 3-phenylpropionic acid transporter